MDPHTPPQRADREVATTRPRRTGNAEAPIIDFHFWCNSRLVQVKRCLPREEWEWLRQAATTADFFAEWRAL